MLLTKSPHPKLAIRSSKSQPDRRRRANRKVRTGCKTCKIRKVKCDEARPICRRCQKADIVCDGYDDSLKQVQRQDLVAAVHAGHARPIFPKIIINVPHPLSTPHHLAVPELLFFNIERYMSASFGNCTWVAVGGETCENITTGGDRENLNDFYNYCSTSVELFKKKRFVEGRRAVSQACALVQNIIKAENPLTVEYLLHVLLFLVRGDIPEIPILLSRHISNMAKVCLAPEHTWAQILRLIGNLDQHHCEEIILEAWKCMNEMYKHGLGDTHQVSLQSEVNMVKFCLTGPNLYLAEQRFREIQLRTQEATGWGSEASFNVFNSLWRNLCAQSKFAEAEETVWEFLDNAGELKHKEYHVLGFSYLARSQFQQAKLSMAKRNIIEAMKFIGLEIPIANPWGLRELLILQSFWQEWDFGVEPVELGEAIEERMQYGKIVDDEL